MRNADYITCVEQYSEMVFRIAFSYFGNQEDAEDLMQDVFLKLLRTDQLPDTDEQKKAWLIRVTVNQCHSMFRSPFRKRKTWLEDYEWNSFADESSVEEDVTRRYTVYSAPACEGNDHSDETCEGKSETKGCPTRGFLQIG